MSRRCLFFLSASIIQQGEGSARRYFKCPKTVLVVMPGVARLKAAIAVVVAILEADADRAMPGVGRVRRVTPLEVGAAMRHPVQNKLFVSADWFRYPKAPRRSAGVFHAG